jgi:predicted ribosome quality control (RQC) complex YloA/Tae2 family protein
MFEKKGNTARKKSKNLQVLTLSYEGATIYVGKNNLQNNYITHQISRKQDYWFHVKDYHGSHVLLKSEELNEDLIRFCANLAAYFSRSSQGSSVPVDYTQISQLKKVPGSKIGFVTMKSYKTIYIDPDLEQIASWIDQYRIKK